MWRRRRRRRRRRRFAPSLVKFLYRLSTDYIRSAAVAASPVG
jgi:murein endopeptidase